MRQARSPATCLAVLMVALVACGGGDDGDGGVVVAASDQLFQISMNGQAFDVHGEAAMEDLARMTVDAL